MELTLLAAALTGVAALWLVLRFTDASSALDLAVTAAVVGMFTGRIAAMVTAGLNPLTNPLDVLVVRGGVDTVGATVGAVAYLLWTTHRQPGVLARLAPAAVAGVAGWHAGCLWTGSCLGAAGDLAWGWSLPGSDVVRHPVELYTAALLGFTALALTRHPGGTRLRPGLALAAVAAARLVTEPLRPGLGAGPIWWYVAGVAAGLVSAMLGGSFLRRPSPLRS